MKSGPTSVPPVVLSGLIAALTACAPPLPPAGPQGEPTAGPPGANQDESAGGRFAELEPEAELAEAPPEAPLEASDEREGGAAEPGPAPEPAVPASAPAEAPGRAGGRGGMAAYEAGVAAAVNRLRRDPAGLVPVLERHRRNYRGDLVTLPGVDAPILTMEGVSAVNDAINAARRARPRPPVRLSPGLSRAARAHASEIGRAGTIDHTGRDGSEPHERMGRHGRLEGLSGENIGTGWGDADFMVLSLFIDDGVRGRGHRVNLLESDYRVLGVGCAPHRRFGTVCVLDLAAEFRE